ncbi:MAG TPA: NAD-dependent epimerase/dehydratase family protein [Actinomycetota bacterium]
MRVLVTGGAGYVGGVVALRLRDAGHEVASLTRPAGHGLGSGHGGAPRPGVTTLTGDLRDAARLGELVATFQPEGVCHLAARVRVRESLSDPLGYFETNLAGTLHLLRALELESLPERTGQPPRLVFASAGAVYDATRGVPLREDAPVAPTTPYAASKLAAEQLIAAQTATGRLAAVTLRTLVITGSGPDGCRPDDDRSRLLPKALAVAAGLEPVLAVNGDGSAVREYTHVADVADAYLLALDAARPGEHQVFNIGSGIAATITDLVATVEAVTGRPLPVIRRPAQPEPQTLQLDSGHARATLGWQPRYTSLRELIEDGWARMAATAGAQPE